MHKRASDSGKFRFLVLNAITHYTEFQGMSMDRYVERKKITE